jgi:hypothetical protein
MNENKTKPFAIRLLLGCVAAGKAAIAGQARNDGERFRNDGGGGGGLRRCSFKRIMNRIMNYSRMNKLTI